MRERNSSARKAARNWAVLSFSFRRHLVAGLQYYAGLRDIACAVSVRSW